MILSMWLSIYTEYTKDSMPYIWVCLHTEIYPKITIWLGKFHGEPMDLGVPNFQAKPLYIYIYIWVADKIIC